MKKYLCLSDFHIPDHNQKLLPLIYRLINAIKFDKLFILGDFVNFTKVSKYLQDPHYKTNIQQEIEEARHILHEIRKRYLGPILWVLGNHEQRLMSYICRNADEIAELELEGEEVLSFEHLFQTKKYNISVISGSDMRQESGVLFEHGDLCRKYSGFTGKAMLDNRDNSGVSGHTHRQSLTFRTQMGKQKFWIENGSLCNLSPTPQYAKNPDWQNGFSVLYLNESRVYPQLVPVIKNSFIFEGKLYG